MSSLAAPEFVTMANSGAADDDNFVNRRHFRYTLQWRHNERNGASNHHPQDRLLYGLFRRRSKKTSKFRVTGLWEGNSPVTGEFPAQRASNVENVSIWWRHHEWGSLRCHGVQKRLKWRVGIFFLNILHAEMSILIYTLNIINTTKPAQTGRHIAEDIFKCIFLNENLRILIQISLRFISRGTIHNIT